MDIGQLRNSRATRRVRINNLLVEITQAIANANQHLVEALLEKIKQKEDALHVINCNLETQTTAANLAGEINDNEDYNETIIDAKILANRFLKGLATVARVGAPTPKNVRLPKLQITKFDGNLADFIRFWDQFTSSIHLNTEISKVDKFNYLKSLLVNNASATIAGLPLSDDNYDIAIQLIEDKYGDKQLLVAEHTKQLWEMRRVNRIDNGVEVRKLIEDFQRNIRVLESLGQDVSTMGALLCPTLLRCIPNPLVREWHRRTKGVANYNLQELIDFIKEELKGIELTYSSVQLKDSSSNETSRKKEQRFPVSSASALVATEGSSASNGGRPHYKIYCIFCNEGNTHTSSTCPRYVSNQERRTSLAAARRCFKCLRKVNHSAKSCDKRIECRVCGAISHHSLLCNKRSSNTSSALAVSANAGHSKPEPRQTELKSRIGDSSFNEASSSQSALVASATSSRSRNQQTISVLQTIRVWVKHNNGSQRVTALIDNGSEKSFCTSNIVRSLGLPTIGEEDTLIRAFGGGQCQQRSHVIPLELMGGNGVQLNITALEVPEICHGVRVWETSLIERFLRDNRTFSWAQKMGSGELESVDVLIGADYYWQIMTGQMKRLTTSLMATNSIFGWLLQGCAPMYKPIETTINMCVAVIEDSQSLNSKLSSLWTLDNSGIMEKEEDCTQTLEDIEVLEEFTNTTTFEGDRYQVRIPWNKHKPELALNYDIALERLRKLLFKLQKDPPLFERYRKALFEYEANNHAKEVTNVAAVGGEYYMPHHAIIRDDRKTTKTRIVFDASSSPPGGLSLNDCQFAGPNLNPCIFNLLLRFRWSKIGMTSDLSKAFLQVLIHPMDRDTTRFLWSEAPWKSGTQPQLRIFHMQRVLFGSKSSPFLLAATIRHHVRLNDPEISQHVADRTYVDDYLSGAESTIKAYELSSRVYLLMLQGGMEFAKWATNDLALRKLWIRHKMAPPDDVIEPVKVLGLFWNLELDELFFQHSALLKAVQEDSNTKRNMLEILARIFDPLGFLSPITVIVKGLLQALWQLKLDWDAPLPENILRDWIAWKEDLHLLESLRTPRWLQVSGLQNFQVHTFCDAGPHAYACVVFFRFQESVGSPFQATLVAAKARIAPIKLICIPRLELMACLIGSRLAKSVCQALSVHNSKQFFWSDSTVALKWIEDAPSRWKVFVARRVQEIQANTPENGVWLHCSSKQNIADIVTRGQSLKKLMKNSEWWHGPKWLQGPEEEWSASGQELQQEEEVSFLSEEQTSSTVLPVNISRLPLLKSEDFSTWSRLTRVTAWILRFCNNCQAKDVKQFSWLSAEEIKAAEMYWVSVIQLEQFAQEFRSLLINEEVDKSSCLHVFNPFLDKQRIIRLGGRLDFSDFSYTEKHPFLLRGSSSRISEEKALISSRLVELFVLDRHVKTLHGGVQSTLLEVRRVAWIVRGRQVVRKAIHNCLRCRRWNARPLDTIEAPLPHDRLSVDSPFTCTGLDFAGPAYVKSSEGTTPVFICLFTCAVTRALHLELVWSQSTTNFILALRRFFARRGGCKTIFSDNSKTFQKANRLLKESYALLRHPQTQEAVTRLGITWKFIPPRAAWHGGFYETMVQQIKYHLKRTLGSALLSFDELATVLVEVEAVINNRPLAPMTDDFSDNEYLTPSHFLLGKTSGPLTDSLLQEDISTKPKLQKRWKYRTQLLDRFWRQWKKQYLLQLRTAHSVKQASRNQDLVKVNDVVLIMDERLPRGRWRLAKVTEVTTGRDGNVRSALLQTADKQYFRRAIQHLCPLEVI